MDETVVLALVLAIDSGAAGNKVNRQTTRVKC